MEGRGGQADKLNAMSIFVDDKPLKYFNYRVMPSPAVPYN